MKKLLLLAGAAAFAVGAPALAQPGKGHGKQAKSHVAKPHGKPSHGVVHTSGGRLFALDARGSCPPGLAKKGNGCLPPGQAKKMFNVGQRYDRTVGHHWAYNQIPQHLRNQYSFDPNGRYYYNEGYLYRVDPKTMLVQQVVSALLR